MRYSVLMQAFKPCLPAIGAILAFSMIINILMLTGSLYMLQIYDRVLSSGSVQTLGALTFLVLLLYGLYGFLEMVRARIMVRIGRLGDVNLQERVFDCVAYHAVRRTAGVRTGPIHDLSTVRQFVSGSGPFVFCDLPWAPLYLLVIMLLHPILGAFSFIAMLAIATVAIFNDHWTRAPIGAHQRSQALAGRVAEESASKIESATALGMVSALRDRWRRMVNDVLNHQTAASDRSALTSSLSRTLRLVLQSGILCLGAYLAIKREISPGTMVAASIIMSRALAPIEQAVAQWQPFLNFQRALARLSNLLESTPSEESPLRLPKPQGRVQVEALTCFAAGLEKPIVSGISFELTPGAGLGIIGPTGAGKSTVARALVGIWPNHRGTVRLDGATLQQWGRDQLGRHIGYLPQDVDLFDGTIADNIARFDKNLDSKAVIRAAQHANVHDLILGFPAGYNTVLSETGARLSAGQRQRIGLARALYRDPVLLVLDEPNSNLDAEGEAALVKAIEVTRQRGATVVVVAHRPSALAALSELMMLRGGQCLAFGPRDEVLNKVIAKSSAATNGLAVVSSRG